jgi:hypothetical protein
MVTEKLNSKFDIIPLLYGSLGLELTADVELEPQDIDVLIPLEFLNKRWAEFKKVIEELGYHLVDIREHEFCKGEYKMAFSFIEDLEEFAGINMDEIEVMTQGNARYKLLNIAQYYKVYEQSIKDGYRVNTRNKKDSEKLAIIKRILNNKGI